MCEACWSSIRASVPLDEHFPASHPVSWITAAGTYDGRMKDIIHALKYDRRRSISPRLGAMMRDRGAAVLRNADAVVPVPLHPWREYRRGFNQARDLATHLGLPVVPMLKRVAPTRSQIDLPRHERMHNVRHAFAIATPAPDCPIVVLIDDVSTTGATLESCARVLRAAGVNEVRALTAARVVNAPR